MRIAFEPQKSTSDGSRPWLNKGVLRSMQAIIRFGRSWVRQYLLEAAGLKQRACYNAKEPDLPMDRARSCFTQQHSNAPPSDGDVIAGGARASLGEWLP